MNGSSTTGGLPPSAQSEVYEDPLTTTQKIWAPISELNESHQRTMAQMTQAYAENDLNRLARAQSRIERIEAKLQAAYRRAREYALSKVQHGN